MFDWHTLLWFVTVYFVIGAVFGVTAALTFVAIVSDRYPLVRYLSPERAATIKRNANILLGASSDVNPQRPLLPLVASAIVAWPYILFGRGNRDE